jgi:hypothetical protein
MVDIQKHRVSVLWMNRMFDTAFTSSHTLDIAPSVLFQNLVPDKDPPPYKTSIIKAGDFAQILTKHFKIFVWSVTSKTLHLSLYHPSYLHTEECHRNITSWIPQ